MADLASALPTVILLAVLGAVLVYRVYRMSRGAAAHPGRLLAAAAAFTFLFAILLLGDLLILPAWFVAVAVALLVAWAVVAAGYVRSHVDLRRGPDGQWTYRLGWLLPAVYLSLFGVRIAVDLVVLGASPFGASPGSPPPAPAGWTLLALGAVNALFAVSAGLIVGRSVGVYLALGDRAGASASPAP